MTAMDLNDTMETRGRRSARSERAGVHSRVQQRTGGDDCRAAPAQALPATAQAGTPVVVSCEPHQRTLVRPAVVNGARSRRSSAWRPRRSAAAQPRRAPLASAPRLQRRHVVHAACQQPVYSDLPDAQVVPVEYGAPVRTNQVVYDERPVRKTRSVAKSAIIIGSSAGAGAGVGAAVGGKKGALIGAAIGGGGATLWDQMTRRK